MEFQQAPQGLVQDSEPVNLYFSCKKIKDADVFSKSDPFVKVYRYIEGPSTKQEFLGRTEVIQDNLNPDFETAIRVDYLFEKHQKMKAELWDCDDPKTLKGDFLGRVDFTLGDILGSQFNLKVFPILLKGKKHGRMIVRVEQENDLQKFEMDFNVGFRDIPKTGFFSSRIQFFEIRKQRVSRDTRSHIVQNDVAYEKVDQTDWQLVYRSQPKKGEHISFSVSKLKSSKICDNDFNLPIEIILMKYKSNGSHYRMAGKKLTLNQLLGNESRFTLDNDKKIKSSSKISLIISNFKRRDTFEFTDYLKCGLNMTQFVGIDFTGSNGNPADPNSLHYVQPGRLNQYQRAILSLGEILEKYNNNGIIPCYGFGARIQGGPTCFDFPLNLNYQAPFLKNYGEMFNCYQGIFSQIQLSGPTNFAPLLRAIIEYTVRNMSLNEMNYTVYIILTDGAISDMNETVREVVNASRLPISIIIIGTRPFLFVILKAWAPPTSRTWSAWTPTTSS